ncbi:MAG: hypothetical protein MSA07_03495 [Mucispirillum sp.]|nr:hypothetical protein [Mucispirillum sp.]
MDNNFKIIKNSLEAISTELDSMIFGVGSYYRDFSDSEQEDIADLVVKVLDKANQLNEEVVRIDFEIDK